MSFYLKKVSRDDWKMMASPAHVISFGENRDPDLDRIDFALITVDDKGDVAGYMTCLELDRETVYWQHGGAMPEYRGSPRNLTGFGLAAEWCREHYKRVSIKVENRNVAMMKIALREGFLVVGTHTFKNKVYVDLLKEFGG